MEPITEIRIECEGATTLPMDSLVDLQGNLKDLTEENYAKLRNSIIEYGFSFPLFVWKDEEGKNYILDAHQRIRTLQKMRSEGITIPDLPADIIKAKDKVEAKKKLLLLNSRYGKMTREGYDEFIAEPGMEIPETELEDMLVLPEIEMWEKNEGEVAVSEHTRGGITTTKTIVCPSCNHEFVL